MAEPVVGLSLGYAAESLSDLGAALEQAASYGVDAAEIYLPALGVVVAGRTRPAALAELRRICADQPLALTLHGPLSADLGRPESAALDRDVARAGLEVCAEIGAPVYVQHGTSPPSVQADALPDWLAQEREALAALAPEARAAGARIGVETMASDHRFRAASPAEMADSLRMLDMPEIGATVDFSHAALCCAARDLDYLPGMAALAPFAVHLHLHDSFARAALFRAWSSGDALAFGFGDLHLPPGAGSLPWDDLAEPDWRPGLIVNLELGERWAWEMADSVAWTRGWAKRAGISPRA